MWEYVKFWLSQSIADGIKFLIIVVVLILLIVLFFLAVHLRDKWRLRKGSPMIKEMQQKIISKLSTQEGVSLLNLEIRVLGQHVAFN